jgi:hypothetical protein
MNYVGPPYACRWCAQWHRFTVSAAVQMQCAPCVRLVARLACSTALLVGLPQSTCLLTNPYRRQEGECPHGSHCNCQYVCGRKDFHGVLFYRLGQEKLRPNLRIHKWEG